MKAKKTLAFLISFFLVLQTQAQESKKQNQSGVKLYKEHCLICHGEKGWGDGPAAKFLDPKPRDFRKGIFKLRSTATLPTDEDIFRTISLGIPGTLMPAFEDLEQQDRRDLVAYVKSFSERFKEEAPDLIDFPNPPPQTEKLLTLGKIIYDEGGCYMCHGRDGKGDGPSAKTLVDSWGNPIIPYDFTIPGRMKSGQTVSDVYRAFYVGIGGTPMPAYSETFTEEQNWGLAYYALSLADSDENGDDWGDDDDDWGDETVMGDPLAGKDLIMGVTNFKNGGPPCLGCHSLMGIGASGGGPWGPDLTIAFQKFKEYGLSIFLETIPYPTMGPLYHPRPLTDEERGHVLAFLKSTQPAEVQVVTARVSPLYTLTILISFLGVFLLTLTGLIAGKKNMEIKQ